MEFIKIIKDEDFGLDSVVSIKPRTRYAARGIIFNDKNEIALLNKVEKNEYKLIGGGMENNETPEETFIREAFEETGCQIKIDKFLGLVKEEKTLDNFRQISYVYVSHVERYGEELNLTEKEIAEGSKVIWASLEKALHLIRSCESNLKASHYENLYHSKFIVRRDLEILNYYKNL